MTAITAYEESKKKENWYKGERDKKNSSQRSKNDRQL